MPQSIKDQIKRVYFKLIKSCLKGNTKKQAKWNQKLINLELELAKKKNEDF